MTETSVHGAHRPLKGLRGTTGAHAQHFERLISCNVVTVFLVYLKFN